MSKRIIYPLVAGLFFAIILGFYIFQILASNGGVFTYTLDDPYIHMQVARNLISNGT